jgi:FKBP-type peptidyl-prolyl cis-trans isomerase
VPPPSLFVPVAGKWHRVKHKASYACVVLLSLLSLSACRSHRAAPGPSAAPPSVAAPPDVKAPPADAQRTASGLATKVLQPGRGGEHPEPQDLVEVHYTGWTPDGKMFDSSIPDNSVAQFSVEGVIPGWQEALQLMVAGEKRRLWVPANLAYGDKPQGKAPAGPLVFDVELMKVIKKPRPLPAPDDVAAPPAGAPQTPSGLSYKVLTKGTGKQHPRPDQAVEVDYTGWDSHGKMIDSTKTGGRPATFRAGGLGKGWTEALAVMVEGEKARFWMPAKVVGWGGPAPLVVYDIELRAIK